MNKDILKFNQELPEDRRAICDLLAKEISACLVEAESKIWHGSPVWFLEGNPVAGYDSLKGAVRLLFWSGQSFDTPGLSPEGSFKAAEVRFADVNQIDVALLRRWLGQSRDVQWNYKDIVKNKGQLDRIK